MSTLGIEEPTQVRATNTQTAPTDLGNCPDCNNRISVHAFICPQCGKPFGFSRLREGWTSTIAWGVFFVVLGVIALIAVAGGSFYFYQEENNKNLENFNAARQGLQNQSADLDRRINENKQIIGY